MMLKYVHSVCVARGVSERSTEIAMTCYDSLVHLQHHFSIHRNQKRVRQSHRSKMVDGEGVLVFDFGEDDVLSDIETFITKLQEADLVLEIDESSAEENNLRSDIETIALKTYEAPDLVKFGDLETLMLSGE